MALIYMDSFEYYSQYQQKWPFSSSPTAQPPNTTPRTGARHYQVGSSSRSIRSPVFPSSHTTWIVGGAWNFSNNDNCGVFGFYDGVNLQVGFRWDGTNIAVYRSTGTLLGSVGFSPTNGIYYYMEMKATINSTTGSVVIRVNGQTVLTLTNVNTNATGSATANGVACGDFYGFGVNSPWKMDDFYLCDGSTGAGSNPCNDFLGDIKVECLMPNGNGNSSQLVGSDGNSTDNYLLVDEKPQNDDTDYVESSTVGNKDTYAYENLASTSGSVYGVQIAPWAKKTDAGIRSIKTIARLSTTEVDGPEQFLASGYSYLPDIRATKPGGGDWTITDVNNAEFGVKVFA